jgi:hypothetical protein
MCITNKHACLFKKHKIDLFFFCLSSLLFLAPQVTMYYNKFVLFLLKL